MSSFEIAELALALAQGWLWAGVMVAVAFLAVGIERADPAARGAWAFRALIAPGLVLLWPLVLWRWAVPAPDVER